MISELNESGIRFTVISLVLYYFVFLLLLRVVARVVEYFFCVFIMIPSFSLCTSYTGDLMYCLLLSFICPLSFYSYSPFSENSAFIRNFVSR
mmetsp:Transcript_3410/g.3731  ORF Transcript_3410/g.3731 Transcript_3410/m.3731 type:complete len:92 (+) Transcript_3410:233-508(+)